MQDRHISYIDGLRAVAILAVIAFHLRPQVFTGAFSGVDIFFVISGFVVSASLARRREESFLHLLVGFYARRIARILPALLLVVWVSSILTILLTPRVWLSQNVESTAYFSMIGFSNWFLSRGAGYFETSNEFNPFMHTWSLGIEEQFYFVFPLIFFFVSSTLVSRRSNKFAIWSFIGLFVISFVVSMVRPWGAAVSFYSSIERFWELGAGVLLYLIVSSKWLSQSIRLEIFIRAFQGRLFLFLSALTVLAGLLFSNLRFFPFPWAILPVAGTCGLLFGLHAEFQYAKKSSLIYRTLSSRPMVFVGRLSYSLYLWHWPVIAFFHWTVGIQSLETMTLALLVSVILSCLSFYLVERPVRRAIEVRSWKAIYVILVALIFIGTSYWSLRRIYWKQPELSLTKAAGRGDWWTGFDQPMRSPCLGRVKFEDVRGGTIVEVAAADCERPKKSRRLFVLGDSHAVVYGPLLEKFTAEWGIDVSMYTIPSCEVFNMAKPLATVPTLCENFLRFARQAILERAQAGDILFVVGLKVPRLSEQTDIVYVASKYPRLSELERQEVREMKFERFGFGALLEKAVRVVLEAPKPIFRSSPFRCVDQFNSMNPACEAGFEMSRSYLLADREPVMTAFADFASSSPLVSVWDPFPILCPYENCRAFLNDRPLYMDGDHISRYGNLILYESFVEHVLK